MKRFYFTVNGDIQAESSEDAFDQIQEALKKGFGENNDLSLEIERTENCD